MKHNANEKMDYWLNNLNKSFFKQDVTEEQEYLSSGVELLNNALDGGYKYNCLIEISGESGTGKTSLILKAISQVNIEKFILYIDTKGDFNNSLIANLPNKDNIIYINPLYVEQLPGYFNKVVVPLIEDIELIVLDDLSSLTTKSELESKTIKNTALHRHKTIKALLQRIKNLIRTNKTSCLIVNQIRNSFDENGDKSLISTSENIINLFCTTRIRLNTETINSNFEDMEIIKI